MILKRLLAAFFLSGILILNLFADEIKIPRSHMELSLQYLAHKLGVNMVYTNFDNCMASKFAVEASSFEDVISAYNARNSEFLRIEHIKDSNTIICIDKRNKEKEEFLGKILDSKITVDKNKKIYVVLEDKKIMLDISGENEKQIVDAMIWHIAQIPSSTLKGAIIAVFKKDNSKACRIPLAFADNAEIEEDDEVDKDFNLIIEHMAQTEGREEANKFLEAVKKSIEKNKKLSESITIEFLENNFVSEPSYEQILDFLKKSENDQYENPDGSISHMNVEFWLKKNLTFDSLRFIEFLIEKNAFNTCSPYSSEMYLAPIPSILHEESAIGSLAYLLKNMEKIKSRDMQECIVGSFIGLDKSSLDKEAKERLLHYAKLFKIERLYLDTSKWIGDDLPEDYDRWQSFKVPDTELVFERDKLIDKTQYHLKFFKYKEAIKIGGTPLRKVEEADYSTPEKSYFSAISARTYEWSKAAIYDTSNYKQDDFSLYAQWKRWNSGLNPFVLILYKIEVSQIGEQKKDSPDLFLLIKLLGEENMFTAIPMKFDTGCWKFYISRPRHVEILSDYIQKEIGKIDSRIKDGQ